MKRMDDLETPFADFPFLHGVDLTLWVQLLLTTLFVAGAGALLAVALG